jgi:hypothetical protein
VIGEGPISSEHVMPMIVTSSTPAPRLLNLARVQLIRLLVAVAALGVASVHAMAGGGPTAPSNDTCAAALVLLPGVPQIGTLVGASSEAPASGSGNGTGGGSCSCALGGSAAIGALAGADVYYRFTTPTGAGGPGLYTISLCGSIDRTDTVVSLHAPAICPAGAANEVACDDDGCAPSSPAPGGGSAGWPSRVSIWLGPGETVLVRVALYSPASMPGSFQILLTAPASPVGACCLGATPSASCTPVTEAECSALAGRSLGELLGCMARQQLPRQFEFPGLPANLPDGPTGDVARTLVIPDSDPALIADVSLRLGLVHSFIGDLRITLERPETPLHPARIVTVLSAVGAGWNGAPLGSPANVAGNYAFSDTGPLHVWGPASSGGGALGLDTAAVVSPGGYFATDASSAVVSLRLAFNGQRAAGTWILRVQDTFPGDTGRVTSAVLELDQPFVPACSIDPDQAGACCRDASGGMGNLCLLTSLPGCQLVDGSFRGAGTVCGTSITNPTTCCRVNFNRVDGVTVADLFDFLSAWFSGSASADFDRDNVLSVPDLFAFLAAWFAGCR